MGNMVLTKEMILAAQDLKVEREVVPEWGGEVRLRQFSGAARDEYIYALQQSSPDGETVDPRGLMCRLLAGTIVDEDNNLIFTAEDLIVLNEKSAAVISRLFDKASAMNGLGRDQVEEARKNS